MKKIFTLRRTIIAVSAVVALIVGSTFLIMYAGQFMDKQGMNVEPAQNNVIVLTPNNFESYGELMFAYIGENNYLYNLDDESSTLIEEPASLLLYASDDTVIYTAAAETDAAHYGRESVIQELQIGEHENTLFTIATVSIDPCWSSNDEVVYFVKDDHQNQLFTFEPLTSTTEMAAEFEETITGLRISSDGLLVTTESGMEMLYVPLSKQLTEAYYNSRGSRIIVCEQYDLILSPDGVLYYRWLGSNEAVKIADQVIVTQGYQDNQIFFIQQTEEGASLKDYFVSEEQTVELAKLPDNILPQLTVSADYAFVIDDYYIVYKYDIDQKEFIPFCEISDDVKNPLISVFDYRLMVYDIANEVDCTFAYMVDATQNPTEAQLMDLNNLQEIYNQERNPDFAEYPTLQMASIGWNVSNLQNVLFELGYLNSEPTGIFDVQTTVAIQYLQSDLGLPETGVVNGELYSIITNEGLSEHQGYSAISGTSSGIEVQDVQARLKYLGYMTEKVSGTMDTPTENAIALFSEQNGFEYTGGVVMPAILEGLFDKQATSYHGYLALYVSDCSPSVTKLNTRLKELGYLKGSVNPTYDAKTVAAIKLLESVNDLPLDENCSQDLASTIFSENVQTCPSELAPEDINDSISSNENQVISDRQLKIIRKWLTKQFAVNHTDRQAVKRLQMQLVKLGYMNQQAVSMIYDQNTFNAVEAFQRENGLTVDGIASKNTLTDIFNMVVKNDGDE